MHGLFAMSIHIAGDEHAERSGVGGVPGLVGDLHAIGADPREILRAALVQRSTVEEVALPERRVLAADAQKQAGEVEQLVERGDALLLRLARLQVFGNARQRRWAELLGVGALSGLLASSVAMAVGAVLARSVFEFQWAPSPWVPLAGMASGALASNSMVPRSDACAGMPMMASVLCDQFLIS